jgi:hypothetical protein
MADQQVCLTVKVRLYRKVPVSNTDYYSTDFTFNDVKTITTYYKSRLSDILTRFNMFYQGGQIFGFTYENTTHLSTDIASPPYDSSQFVQIDDIEYYVSGIIIYDSSQKKYVNRATDLWI